MLLAPVSGDIPRPLGFVSSLPSSGDETTGFAEQLTSADSELSSVPARAQTAASIQSFTSDRVKAAREDTRRPSNHSDALPHGKTNVQLNQEPPQLSVMAITLPVTQGGVPASSGRADSSQPFNHPVVTAAAIQGMLEHGSSQTGMASVNAHSLRTNPAAHQLPEDNPNTSQVPSAASGSPKTGILEQIAFAVKVEQARSLTSASHTSGSDAGSTGNTSRQASAGKTAADNTENADTSGGSEANGGRQTRDNGADQAPSAVNDATPKGTDKKPDADATPQQHPAASNDAFAINPVSIADELSARAASTTDKATLASPDALATPDDPVVCDQLSRPGAPMKDISVRVETAQGQNVDVRIIQRRGDLQIAVKSESVDTTQGLRRGLSELTSRLNESGYQAETWRPGLPAAASGTATGSGNSSDQPPSGNSQSNSSWSQQNPDRRDNNPSNRPRWISELESKLATGAESTGQFHGLLS